MPDVKVSDLDTASPSLDDELLVIDHPSGESRRTSVSDILSVAEADAFIGVDLSFTSAVLVTLPFVVFTVEAGKRYKMAASLYVSADEQGADLQIALAPTGSLPGHFAVDAIAHTEGGYFGTMTRQVRDIDGVGVRVGAPTTGRALVRFEAVLIPDQSRLVAVQSAQIAAGGTTTIHAGSHIAMREIR